MRRARLPYLSPPFTYRMGSRTYELREPACRDIWRGEDRGPAPNIGHGFRGIPWPGTENEEYRRAGVSRCMQRCGTCGLGRVTRYDDQAKEWTVEGFLGADPLPGEAAA